MFNQKKQIILGEKAGFSNQKWRFPPFKTQDIIWTWPLTWHAVNSALIMNYDELNRFSGSLTYNNL